jgi:hypothetical protein
MARHRSCPRARPRTRPHPPPLSTDDDKQTARHLRQLRHAWTPRPGGAARDRRRRATPRHASPPAVPPRRPRRNGAPPGSSAASRRRARPRPVGAPDDSRELRARREGPTPAAAGGTSSCCESRGTAACCAPDLVGRRARSHRRSAHQAGQDQVSDRSGVHPRLSSVRCSPVLTPLFEDVPKIVSTLGWQRPIRGAAVPETAPVVAASAGLPQLLPYCRKGGGFRGASFVEAGIASRRLQAAACSAA